MEHNIVELESKIEVVLHAAHFRLDVLVHFSFVRLRLAAMIHDTLVQFLVLLVSKELANLGLIFLSLREDFLLLLLLLIVFLDLE